MKVFIGNFPLDVTDRDLEVCCSQWGEIVECYVIRDRKTGRSKGYGFVTFEHHRDALLAIRQLNAMEWSGRKLHVSEARDRKPRTA